MGFTKNEIIHLGKPSTFKFQAFQDGTSGQLQSIKTYKDDMKENITRQLQSM